MHVNSRQSAEKPHSWAVVATVKEPLPLVLAFVAHHLSIGAEEVHLYLDDPDDAAADVLRQHPKVHVTLCDRAYMRSIGFQTWPENQNRRQKRNANDALRRTKCQWMAHLDADEFLVMPGNLGALLSQVVPGKFWVQLPHMERVWSDGDRSDSLFDGPFHFRMPDRTGRAGGGNPMLQMGLAGTVAGKSILRVGKDCVLGIHRPREKPYAAKKIPPVAHIPGAGVLHFHGATIGSWISKTARYADLSEQIRKVVLAPPRRHMIEAFQALSGDVAALNDLHRMLFYMSDEQLEALRAYDLLTTHALETESAVARYFPKAPPLPTPEAFDRDWGGMT